MRVVFVRAATIDLDGIGDYIAERNPERAVTFIRQLKTSARGLARFPKRFPLVERYEHTGVRKRTRGNYLIFYRIAESHVEVLRIVHAARNYEALLFPDE